MIPDRGSFRRELLAWYKSHRRDLPWRRVRDPYRIWLSEIMLQQTRVAAVIPYFERFLEKFPTVDALANAPAEEVLTAWAGLGYYSRARNLQQAAMVVRDMGEFPRDYDSIRALPGVGDYTAAAISSIAYGLPHAVLDGNVARVLARLTAHRGDIRAPRTRQELKEVAGNLMDQQRPGEFNQAMMELGATVCLPRQPQCLLCPVARHCEARKWGLQQELPIRIPKAAPVRTGKALLLVQRQGKLLLWRRGADSKRLAGFWELPETHMLPDAQLGRNVASFRHTIVNTLYSVTVQPAEIGSTPVGFEWIEHDKLSEFPLSTTTKKALLHIQR